MTNGIVDYSLRCLEGPHKNKFVYLSQSSEGETIGSDEDSATLYIENSNLHPSHAHIQYEGGRYYLRDTGSSTGTWVQRGVASGLQVEIDDKMEVKMYDDLIVFSLGELIKDPLKAMFRKFEVEDAIAELRKMGLDTAQKVQTILYEQMEKVSHGNAERRSKIEAAIQAVKTELVAGHTDRKLIIGYGERQYSLKFADFVIGNTAPADLIVSPGLIEKGVVFEAVVTYQQGRYWLLNNPLRPVEALFVRLKESSGGKRIGPEDTVKMGGVVVKVCRFNVGCGEIIGTRDQMEDKIVAVQDLKVSRRVDVSLFGVLDG